MHWIDWLVIGSYFAGLIVVVWWSSRKQNTSADYFLAVGMSAGLLSVHHFLLPVQPGVRKTVKAGTSGM